MIAFLEAITEALEGLHYMIVGSVASSFHGVPRSLGDIDLVIEAHDRPRLLAGLCTRRWHVEPERLIDRVTSWKADLILRKARPFSIEELARRIPGAVAGVPCMVATREDTILSKLEWSKASGSERQLDDVRGILAVSGAGLDVAYVDHWADELGIADLWASVRT